MKKTYWTKEVDKAIVSYNLKRDDKLFVEVIYPALYKLSAYWVNSYALPDTSAEDVCSFLYSVLYKITDEKKNGFAYCGTVCKFYLLRKKERFIKDRGTLSNDLDALDNYMSSEPSEPVKSIYYYTLEHQPSDDLKLLINRLNSNDIPFHEANLISSGYDTYANFLFKDIISNKKELVKMVKWKRIE